MLVFGLQIDLSGCWLNSQPHESEQFWSTLIPAYRRAELEYALVKVGVKALITAESFKTSNYLDMLTDLIPELANCKPERLSASKFPLLNFIIQTGKLNQAGMFRFQDFMEMGGEGDKARLVGIDSKLFS